MLRVINRNGLVGIVDDPQQSLDVGSGLMFKVRYEGMPVPVWEPASKLVFDPTQPDVSDATICRLNGWGPGTRLEGTEYDASGRSRWSCTEVIEITALGDERVLARRVSMRGKPACTSEGCWALKHRDWRKVD